MSTKQCIQEERHTKIQNFMAPAFEALSADVLINVLKFLRPCDIIAVRQTCKALLSITKVRTVWVNALRGVMQVHFITEDTYPLITMSLPMLEHAALSPHRFVSLMERSNKRRLGATSIRVLSSRLTHQEMAIYGISNGGDLQDMFLAPGGRYLATMGECEQVSSLLTIWDLGLSGNDGVKALARFHQPVVGLTVVSFFPDHQKRGIFYLVTTRNPDSNQGAVIIVDVHTITIFPSTPGFTSVTKIEIPTPASATLDVAVCSNLYRVTVNIGETHQTYFLIWDFIRNTAATWVAPECGAKELANVFSYDDSLVAALNDKTLIYNIPSFIPYDPKIPPMHYKPCTGLLSLLPSPDSICIPQPFWPVSQVPQYICVVDDDQIFVHEIKSTLTAHDHTIPNKLPIFAGNAKAADVGLSFAVHRRFTMEQSDGRLFLGCLDSAMEDPAVFMLEVVNPHGQEQNFKLTKAFLFYDTTVSPYYHQLCLSMGRMCFLSHERHELHILDYLVPPA